MSRFILHLSRRAHLSFWRVWTGWEALMVLPLGKKINHHESPVSQKIVLIILSVEGIVLAFFFFEDMMWCHSSLALFWSCNNDTTLHHCSGHHHSQQHVSIRCEATVVYAFLWSSAASPVATIIPVIPKMIQHPFTFDNFCKDHFQTNHHFCKIHHFFYEDTHSLF